MSVFVWIGVAALGAVGALLRFALDGAVSARAGRDLPFGTFAVNISGAFTLGFLAGVSLTGDALVLAGTATVGAFTTFSTWMFETQRLVEDGESRVGFAIPTVRLGGGEGAVSLVRFRRVRLFGAPRGRVWCRRRGLRQ
jgi:CrcB protein